MTRPSLDLADTRLRRVAAVGAVIHVLSFVAAMIILGPPTVHEGQEAIEHSFVDGPLAQAYSGMYVLTIGLLALLPTMAYLARALGRRTPTGAWAARVSEVAGAAYVVIIVGVGLSAGAAALWARHHDVDLATVLALNNVRNFAYLAITPFMGLHAIALGVAAISDRQLTRWVGWGGVGTGTAFLLAIPAAAVGVQYAMPLWLLWWLGTGIVLLRRGSVDGFAVEQPTASATMRND